MKKWLGMVFTIISLLCSLLVPAHAMIGTKFSGQAVAAKLNVLGINTVISDTGLLPDTGGALETSLLSANVVNLIQAEVLHATTIGKEYSSRSESSVAGLNLNVVGNAISAGFIMSRASAICDRGRATTSASSEIVNLVVNGKVIEVTGKPNQTIELLGLKIVINEQVSSGSGDITVNALHISAKDVVLGTLLADVVLASAHADISCGKIACSGNDFVTGGGWILNSNAKANFGVGGGKKNGSLWGHLVYNDHGNNGPKVKGTGLTSYDLAGATGRRITGTADINGQPGTYEVTVVDNGEPGRSDTFSIKLSTGYAASGNLDGGNIQLHKTVCK